MSGEATQVVRYVWDCPSCGCSHESEFDLEFETEKCDDCGLSILIRGAL